MIRAIKNARSDAAERILREAMRLFAERGYERTSVADIQKAAGLTAGSGAMYKHYRSKEALLHEGINGYIAEARRTRTNLEDPTTPAHEALAWHARATLERLSGRRNELRVLWRDLEQFPSLQSKARREIVQSHYRALAIWLASRMRNGDVREHDCEAVAAVILGALVMFRAFEALWGEKVIPVDDERFLRAWRSLVMRGLAIDRTPGSKHSLKKRGTRQSRNEKSKS
jgi:AcrR family transcriptional regulator